eukprot:11235064-Alexandrium_andersonii.AAC.1
MPAPGRFPEWLQTTAESLANSSGKQDELEVEWIYQVRSLSREELAKKQEDNRLAKADAALAQAARAMADESQEHFKHE